MKNKNYNLEQKLSELGAKIATATSYNEQAAVLHERTKTILETVQKEISELYITANE